MKKILVIQSRLRPEMLQAEQGEYKRAVGERAALAFLSALDESRAWSEPEKILAGYDGVMVGGSGEFDLDGGRDDDDVARNTARHILARLTPMLNFLVEHDIPTLGICFGHQLIGEARGGKVWNDHEQKKVGSYAVVLSPAAAGDMLFKTLPTTFVGQYGHKDALSTLPRDAELLAASPSCRFSALRYGKHVYTVQFHPELTAQDVAWKLQNSPGYLPEGVDIGSLIKQSPEASTIIPQFVDRVVTVG